MCGKVKQLLCYFSTFHIHWVRFYQCFKLWWQENVCVCNKSCQTVSNLVMCAFNLNTVLCLIIRIVPGSLLGNCLFIFCAQSICKWQSPPYPWTLRDYPILGEGGTPRYFFKPQNERRRWMNNYLEALDRFGLCLGKNPIDGYNHPPPCLDEG